MSTDLLLQLAVTLISGGAIYGGIRADLKGMHERITMTAASATAAHTRIDNHLEKGTHK